jgi:hypothetical protein
LAARKLVLWNFRKVYEPHRSSTESRTIPICCPTLRDRAALQHVSFFETGSHSAIVKLQLRGRCAIVDFALKLNVVAVFAVFLFIAAILLGAF